MRKITNKRLTKYISLWFPVVVWATVIFIFSAYPTNRASEIHWQDFIVKKTAHIVEYFIFTLLLFRTLKESNMELSKSKYYALFFAIFYAISDEVHQSFTPGREPTIRDVLFDTVGILLALFLIDILPRTPLQLRKLAKKFDIT